jgi:tetratricopeptide (TPR) repeat protein
MATINDILLGANKLFDENRFAEATNLYMLLINEGFETEEILYNRAICEANLGHYEEAFIASNLLLKLNPNVQEILRLRAIALWKFNNFDAANIDFKKGIELGDVIAEKDYRDFAGARLDNYMDHFNVSYENDQVSVDLSNVFFISNQHKRFENNKQTSHSINVERAIRLIQNSSDLEIYEVTIYSLQKPHPVWKSYITMDGT